MVDHFGILAVAAAGAPPEPNLFYIWSVSTMETKIVMGILFVMSMWAWTVMGMKMVQLRRAFRLNGLFMNLYAEKPGVLDIYHGNYNTEDCASPFFNIYHGTCQLVEDSLHSVKEATPVTAPAETAPEFPNPAFVQSFSAVSGNAMGGMAGNMIAPVSNTAPVPVAASETKCLSVRDLDNIRDHADQLIAKEMDSLEENVFWLAIATNGSPFIGLFGTVWGVMVAFAYVGAAGNADLTTMAPGVAGALIATVGGLFVAIPSMFFYNWIVNRLRTLNTEMENYASALCLRIENKFLVK